MAFVASNGAASVALVDNLTATNPSGGSGQLIILAWVNGGGSGATITWPSGFTEFANGSIAAPDARTFKAAYKYDAGSEPGTYNVVSSIGDEHCILMAGAWSGRSGAPVAQTSSLTTAATSVITINATGVTAVAGDDLVWLATQAPLGSEIWAFAPPSSPAFTERQERAASSYVAGEMSTRDNVSAGATGTLDGTMTSGSDQAGWAAIVVRIPAAAGGTVNTNTLTDALSATDGVIQSAIRGNVSTDTTSITDSFFLWWYRNRLLESSVVVTEGATEVYTTTNMVAWDELTLADEFVAYFRRTRIGDDSIAITDELIASTLGYLIFVSVLTSNTTVTDQALPTTYFSRLLESNLVTSDQLQRACFVARSLLDGVDVTDQGLSALQRFILLTDALSLDDSFSFALVTPTTFNPVFVTGFDQPRIELGGYGL
jgi:hypothetical protein